MKFDNLKQLLKHFVEVGPVGCCVSVSLNGKVEYEHYEGFADLEKSRPVTKDTLFRIYSISKVITVAGLMRLFERGAFLLNDPVSAYLPEFEHMMVYHCTGNGVISTEPAKRPITILNLLTMTSGFTYDPATLPTSVLENGYNGPANPTEWQTKCMIDQLEAKGGYTLREFCKAISKIPLAFHPGEGWCYGYGIDIIGALIEVLSGKSLSSFLRDEIFLPLGMNSSCFFVPENRKKDLAGIYVRENGVLRPNSLWDNFYQEEHLFESGGAGILCTLEDLTRFAQMLSMGGSFGGEHILGRKTIDMMRRNYLTSRQMRCFEEAHDNGWDFLKGYGYGLGVRTLEDPAKGGWNGSRGEFAWAGAAGTYLLADPEEKLAICYMHQLRPNNMEEYCTPRIRNVVYGALD